MTIKSQLKYLSPDEIRRNPDNPRLFFRSEELQTLMSSIRRFGVQVPITVYREKDHYVLVDGERRWQCSHKLNLSSIPALVQEKPSPLNNLLLMFNIHALREQWDYLTIANKLPSVIDLFKSENDRSPNEIELSEITGLSRGQIRRCNFLIDLPRKYRAILEEDLAKPKSKQELSEDFFIEMERALKTVQSRVPAAISNLNHARDTLIEKFKTGIIRNITDLRKLSKIATSIENLDVRERDARGAIQKVLDPDNDVSIVDVYSQRFEAGYDNRRISINVDSLLNYFHSYEDEDVDEIDIPDELQEKFQELARLISRVLRRLK